MKLEALMVKIEMDSESVVIDKKIPVKDIFILDTDNYMKNTFLGVEEEGKCWITYTHYRSRKREDRDFYIVGFRIVELEDGKRVQDYSLRFCAKKQSDKFKDFSLEKGIFIDTPRVNTQKDGKVKFDKNGNPVYIDGTVGLDTAGTFYIYIYDKNGCLVREEPYILCVLPSSISYKDYTLMLQDLLAIKEDFVINKNGKVSMLIKKLEYISKTIEVCLEKIKKPMHNINQQPEVKLDEMYTYINKNSVKKFSSRTLIDMYQHSGRSKVKALSHMESTDIYENRMIKYALHMLSLKMNNYKNYYEKSVKDKKKSLERTAKAFARAYGFNSIEELESIVRNKDKRAYFNQRMYNIDKSDKNSESDIIVTFDIYVNRRDYKPKIEFVKDKLKITLEGSYSYDQWNLDLKEGNYYIGGKEENYYFMGQKVSLHYTSGDLYGQLFLLDKVMQPTTRKIRFKALVVPENIYMNDPLGGKELPYKKMIRGKYTTMREYNIKVKKMLEVNGIKVISSKDNTLIERMWSYFDKYWEFDRTIEREYRYYFESINRSRKLISGEEEKIKSLVENWEKSLLSLQNLGFLKEVKLTQCFWNPTQIFVNNVIYRSVWRRLRDLDKEILYTKEYNLSEVQVRQTNSIFEFWCMFKMIHILVNDLQWKLKDEKIMLDVIDDFLKCRPNSVDFKKLSFELYHEYSGMRRLELKFEFNQVYNTNVTTTLKKKEKEKENCVEVLKKRSPDYSLTFSGGNLQRDKRFYIDAKYRNYRMQGGRNFWLGDVNGVAVEKYIKEFEGVLENEADGSYIIHSDTHACWTYFGGYIEEQDRDKIPYFINRPPEHRFGSVSLLPSRKEGFLMLMKMIMEYHLDMFQYCSSCGSTTLPEKKELNATSIPKYYFTCTECGAFWVKNHCKANGHKLIKHVPNYHKQDDTEVPWYVVCPACGDGE